MGIAASEPDVATNVATPVLSYGPTRLHKNTFTTKMASCQRLHVYLFMLPSTYTLLLNFCNSTRDDVPPLKLDAAQWPQKSHPPFHIVPFNIIQFYDKVT